MTIPIKQIDAGLPTGKLSEFEPGDTTDITFGGTGATSAAGARTNLDVPSNADLTTVANSVVTDHGDLTGLGDDDHPQYHNDARGDARYYTQTQADTLLNGKADLVGGLIPASQLPSFVDDIIEGATLAAFPATGETGKIYVALDTNRQYRWSGSIYVDMTQEPLPFSASIYDPDNLATTSSTYQDYIQLSFTAPETGVYKFEAVCRYALNITSQDILIRVRVDNVTESNFETRIEPKDAGGTGFLVPNAEGGADLNSGTNQVVPWNHLHVQTLTAGAHTFDIQFASGDNSSVATMWSGCLVVTRIA